jgi:hypothetical protein
MESMSRWKLKAEFFEPKSKFERLAWLSKWEDEQKWTGLPALLYRYVKIDLRVLGVAFLHEACKADLYFELGES